MAVIATPHCSPSTRATKRAERELDALQHDGSTTTTELAPASRSMSRRGAMSEPEVASAPATGPSDRLLASTIVSTLSSDTGSTVPGTDEAGVVHLPEV